MVKHVILGCFSLQGRDTEAVKNKTKRPLVVKKFFQRQVTSFRRPNRTRRRADTTATTACSWNTHTAAWQLLFCQRDTRRGDAYFCSSVFTQPHFTGAGWPDPAAPCIATGLGAGAALLAHSVVRRAHGGAARRKRSRQAQVCAVEGIVCREYIRGVKQVQFNMKVL